MCPGRGSYSIEEDCTIDGDCKFTIEPLTFQYWGYMQPDNTADMENYVVMEIERITNGYGSSYGAWNDVVSTFPQHTICEYNIPFLQGPGSEIEYC